MKNIISKYKYAIKTIIRNFTGADNEDLEQEVYIKAWKGKDNYTEQNKFSSWIYKITKNVCKDFLKSASFKKVQSTVSDEEYLGKIKDCRQNPETNFTNKQRQNMIIRAIEQLPPKQKEVVILYNMYGLSYEQIAKKMNCPEGTVKSRIFNANKKLAESLKELL